jgi:hypothetical protein
MIERGSESEEAQTQATREESSLIASYKQGDIPDTPSDLHNFALQVPNESETKVMLAGAVVDELIAPPAPSLHDLLAQIAPPGGGDFAGLQPSSLTQLGIDPSALASLFPSLHQQQHQQQSTQPPPAQGYDGGGAAWPRDNGWGAPSSAFDGGFGGSNDRGAGGDRGGWGSGGGDRSGEWGDDDGDGGRGFRGGGGRKRGRGRDRDGGGGGGVGRGRGGGGGGRGRAPCTFFAQGK